MSETFDELSVLENKVEQAVSLVLSLRTENDSLKKRLSTAESENKVMHDTVLLAREKLENLLEKLPENS